MNVSSVQFSATIAALVTLFFVSIFGIFYCSPLIMPMDMHALSASPSDHSISHAGCDTIGASCPMNINDHLAAWAQFLLAIFTDIISAIFVLVSAIALIAHCNSQIAFAGLPAQIRNYVRRHSRFRLYDYFVELFASGIVQPKLLA